MRAVLYARVSTPGQVDKGYSLRQQMEALRQHCERHGIEIVAEVADGAESREALDRPGVLEMLDLAKSGKIDAVLAQDRDRYGTPEVESVLRYMFLQEGCRLKTPDDPADDDPFGQMTAGILNQVSAMQRALTRVRTIRGRKQRAREGRVIGSCPPPYGFRYNEDRTNFEVDPLTAPTCRRIFEMVAAGCSLHGVCRTLEGEGIPTVGNHRKKGERWYPNTVRRIVFNDAYKGVWTYGKTRIKLTPLGKHKRSVEPVDPSKHITVPVPDSGIPHDLVDRARDNINGRYRPRPQSSRYFELARVLFCGECGNRMTHYTSGKYSYYVCRLRRHKLTNLETGDPCNGPSVNAARLEQRVMRHATKLLSDPEKIKAHMDQVIADVPTTSDSVAVWVEQIRECEIKRDRYQEMYVAGNMTQEKLSEKLRPLDQLEAAAREHLDNARAGREKVNRLEADRRALLKAFGEGLERGLQEFTPEGRRAIYEALRLRIGVGGDGPDGGPLLFVARWNENVMKLVNPSSAFSPALQLSG